MWLLSYGTLITPVPVASPRRGEAAVSAEGQEVEEEEEEDEDSLMRSECIKTFAYFISTTICPSKSRSINNGSTKRDILHWEPTAVACSAFISRCGIAR